MKTIRTAVLVIALFVGLAGTTAFAADRTTAPQITADRIAMMLDQLHAPAASALVKTGSSCTTSCGSGPEGSCSKTCSGSQSCQASCSGGKAVCRCE